MTAPDTNLKRQQRRHRWPLLTFALIGVAVIIAIAIFGGITPEDDAALTAGDSPVMTED